MAGVGPRAPRRADAPGAAPSPARARGSVTVRVARCAPPLALMGLIWALSAQHHLATDLGWIDTVLRKGAHMTEYALLTLLWTWALLRRPLPAAGGSTVPGRRAVVAAAAVAIAWAAADELHQTTVSGRVGSPWDVAIDAAGVGVAVLLWRGWTLARTRRAGRRP